MLDDNDTVLVLIDDQEKMIEILKSHMVLQDQFNQLTAHVEKCYARIAALEQVVANKVLS
jgi:hypothetical protein